MQRTIPLLITLHHTGTPTQVAVGMALAEAGAAGSTPAQIAARLALDISPVRRALREMLEAGAAEQTSMGRGSTWVLLADASVGESPMRKNLPAMRKNLPADEEESSCSMRKNLPHQAAEEEDSSCSEDPMRKILPPQQEDSSSSEIGTDDAILARTGAGARVRENREDIEDRLGPGLEKNLDETVKETLVDIHILAPLKKIIRWRTKEKDREDENVQEINALFAKWGGKRCEVKAREYAQKHGKIPWAGDVRELLEAEDIANRPKLYDPWIKIAADLLARGDAENAEKARKLKESQA